LYEANALNVLVFTIDKPYGQKREDNLINVMDMYDSPERY